MGAAAAGATVDRPLGPPREPSGERVTGHAAIEISVVNLREPRGDPAARGPESACAAAGSSGPGSARTVVIASRPVGIELLNIGELTRAAVAHYWRTLDEQGSKQKAGDADRGRRAAVTGGKQMMGFCNVVSQLLRANGVDDADIYLEKSLELPGYFRPTKTWDMLVVNKTHLLAALEFKSQRGPSFGNNFNNRTEEAIGTAQDLWTAYREGAFGKKPRPWLGWVMLLEDCPKSRKPVHVFEPHFKVFPEFRDASYAKRYELLLRRLVREKLFDSAVFLMATAEQGPLGAYTEPSPADLGMKQFLAGLVAHAMAYQAAIR
jgi:hypothetical protein